MSKITYANKINSQTSELPIEQKVRDLDMNEIKTVVNANDDLYIALAASVITNVTAGNGLTGGASSGSATVTLGTPGTISGSTSNSVTSTSHTHSVTTGAVANNSTDLVNGDAVWSFLDVNYLRKSEGLEEYPGVLSASARRYWICTQAEYDAATKQNDVLYFIVEITG